MLGLSHSFHFQLYHFEGGKAGVELDINMKVFVNPWMMMPKSSPNLPERDHCHATDEAFELHMRNVLFIM